LPGPPTEALRTLMSCCRSSRGTVVGNAGTARPRVSGYRDSRINRQDSGRPQHRVSSRSV